MGCSPFKGTLQRLIDAVDANGSGMVMVGHRPSHRCLRFDGFWYIICDLGHLQR